VVQVFTLCGPDRLPCLERSKPLLRCVISTSPAWALRVSCPRAAGRPAKFVGDTGQIVGCDRSDGGEHGQHFLGASRCAGLAQILLHLAAQHPAVEQRGPGPVGP